MRPIPELEVVNVRTDDLVEYENNANTHTAEQIDQIAASIQEFGFSSPVLAWHDDDGQPVIVAGHGRLMAAKTLGLEELPVVFVDHMTDEQRRAFGLVENQLTRLSEFDWDALEQELLNIGTIDMSEYGFDISGSFDAEPRIEPIEAEEDELPEASPTRAKSGQIWQLGDHRLVCGDSTDPRVIVALMDGEEADLLLTDPPYNVDYADKNEMLVEYDKMSRIYDAIEGDQFENIAQYRRFIVGALEPATRVLRAGGGITYGSRHGTRGPCLRRATSWGCRSGSSCTGSRTPSS